MAKTYTIKQGKHSSSGLHIGMVVGNTLLRFKAFFHRNCLYEPTITPDQISKLYGMSYGQHHDCSARIGWRSDGKRIEILSYVYVAHDERRHETMGWMDVEQWQEFTIRRCGEVAELQMGNGPVFSYSLQHPVPAGYRLYPYFGGAIPAPHDMTIEIEILEMDGIGA